MKTYDYLENVKEDVRNYIEDYIPIYSLCGMEYYVNSEGIQIIG